MARVSFTVARVERFECPPGKRQAFLHDAGQPGLALRVTAAGARAYVFERKKDRETIRVTIGSPADWTIEAARARARLLAKMIDEGIDPREEEARRRAEAEAERARQAIERTPARAAWDAYCAERRRAWGARHARDHAALAAPGGERKRRGEGLTQSGPLAELLACPLAELTAETINAWAARHAPIRPTVARLGLRLLSGFLTWCSAHPDYRHAMPQNPLTTAPARAARETLGKPRAKDDCLRREQLRAWFEAVRTLPPVVSAYLQALLLTGARPGEMLALGWADVDFRWHSLTLRDKVEGERTIPLTPCVAALLSDLPRRGPYVFASAKGSGPMASPNRALHRACAMAGIPPLTLHGLRRSFKSLTEWVEVPAGIVAQIQGHKPSATVEKHYARRPLDLLASWHDRIEAWMLAEAGIEQPERTEAAPRLRMVV